MKTLNSGFYFDVGDLNNHPDGPLCSCLLQYSLESSTLRRYFNPSNDLIGLPSRLSSNTAKLLRTPCTRSKVEMEVRPEFFFYIPCCEAIRVHSAAGVRSGLISFVEMSNVVVRVSRALDPNGARYVIIAVSVLAGGWSA